MNRKTGVMEGNVTLVFIRGGISAKTKYPYLQVSNGIAQFFMDIPKEFTMPDDVFSKFKTLDEIELTVRSVVGSDIVTLVDIPLEQ